MRVHISGLTLADGSVRPMSVQEGDTVLLSKYGGVQVEHEGQEFHIYQEDDVLAKYSS